MSVQEQRSAEFRGGQSISLLSSTVLAVAVLFVFSSFAVFHLSWPLVFPTPWNDETFFLIPAVNFATTGSPTAAQMLNSEGIFWVPSGMYLLDGVIFAATGTSGIRFARAISFVEIASAAFLIRQIAVGRLIDMPHGPSKATLISLAWFVCMPIMLAANLARPEAPVLMLSTAAVLCLVHGFAIGGAALALLAFLTHPLLAIPSCGVAGYALLFGSVRKRQQAWEWAVAVLALALLAYEASRLLLHQEAYLEHWTLQLERKVGRQLRPETLASAVLLLTAAVYASVMKLAGDWRPNLRVQDSTTILLLFGLACITVHFYGQEMWYWPFAITGCLFVFLAALPILGWVAPFSALRHTAVFAAAVAVALSTWSLALRDRGFMHFTAQPSSMRVLSLERTTVVADVYAHLVRAATSKTLVSPFIFEELRALSHDAGTAFFTLNPFSRGDGLVFDSFVRIDRNFPVHLSEAGVIPEILSGRRCSGVERFVSAKGTYIMSVVLLSAPGVPGRPLHEC